MGESGTVSLPLGLKHTKIDLGRLANFGHVFKRRKKRNPMRIEMTGDKIKKTLPNLVAICPFILMFINTLREFRC
jgi:hypothetical protein